MGPREYAIPGQVEILSTAFAIGWARHMAAGLNATVYARLGDEILGVSAASQYRDDLAAADAGGAGQARAFTILFQIPVPPGLVPEIKIFTFGAAEPLPRSAGFRLDRLPLRVFILGSPRSGTSQLGASLHQVLGLRWMGESHAAPAFMAAATALTGDAASSNEFQRFLYHQRYRDIMKEAARRAYYTLHSSAAFLDKTPGLAMIRAAPFIQECFPDAKFIFMHRHPIANIQSRLARFGGDFTEHCVDWTETMLAWASIQPSLSHVLVMEQQRMRTNPLTCATALADFLEAPGHAPELAVSLQASRAEFTGAGALEPNLLDTTWSDDERRIFVDLCGQAAFRFGYDL